MEDRKASTLLPINKQMYIPVFITHSDQWKAHRSINHRFRFAHQTVNHTESFVDPITDARTRTSNRSEMCASTTLNNKTVYWGQR